MNKCLTVITRQGWTGSGTMRLFLFQYGTSSSECLRLQRLSSEYLALTYVDILGSNFQPSFLCYDLPATIRVNVLNAFFCILV